jgi:large subunit ribosomal protein L17
MRHRSKKHLKFNGKDVNHRDAMLRNLATSLFTHGKIATTQKRARAVTPLIHKLIGVCKDNNTMNTIRRLQAELFTEKACKAVMDVAAKTEKNSGYTRMTPLKYRAGDASMLVTLELLV